MIGNQPSLTNNAVARTISVTATAGQTLFTVTGGYRINQLGVFRNGTRLVDALDYNARDGATVTLLSPANASDVLEFQVFDDFRVADALNVNSGGTVNGAVTIVSAATTALLVEGNARVTGILTVGNSSITFDGTNNSINIGSVSIAETGITGGTSDIVTRNITGVAATFTGNVSIAGTLTYEDVTNIDSVGLITARSGIVLTGGNVTLGTGVTASGSTANTFTLSTNGSERVRVDSSGNINVDSGGVYYDAVNNRLAVGTTSGVGKLTVYTSTAYTPGTNFNDGCLLVGNGTATTGNIAISYDNTNGAAFTSLLPGTAWKDINYGANQHIFSAGGFERARIDSSGRLLVGTSSTSESTTMVVQGRPGDPNGGGAIFIQGNYSGDPNAIYGEISFKSTGGTLARISGVGDLAHSGDAPGRLVFSTTADGLSSPTDRLYIKSNTEVQWRNVTELFPFTDNACLLGKTGYRWSAVWAANGTIQTSDKRAKTEISDAVLGSSFVKALRPVSYKWIEGGKRHAGEYDADNNCVFESVPGTRTHWGFIAQEVKQAVDAAGVDFGGWVLTDKDDPNSQQALRYDQFIAPLTKALQEVLAEIDVLKAKVAALQGS